MIGTPETGIMCDRCNTPVAVVDGVLDFVHDPTGPLTTQADYDALHHVDDERSDARYRDLKRLAGGRWPTSLGSVLEVGCGTGLLTRALVRGGDAADLTVTDISLPMLRATREYLDRAGLLAGIPVSFATHGGTEPVFRDNAFDTCVGTSVLHHMVNVRGFLGNVFRWLKPGGRAFFTEPNLRYHRALGQTLADILALLHGDDSSYGHGKQSLLNVIGQWRLGILHQDDLPFLGTLDDKHMFACDSFEAMGRELGFATALAIPVAHSPSGLGFTGRLCTQLGVEEPLRSSVLGLLPAFAGRYMSLLSPQDQTASFLFWLEKGTGPAIRHFTGPPAPEAAPPADLPEAFRTGGLRPRWSLALTASRTPDGIAVSVRGWCLVNTDVKWVRVTLGGVARRAPVWLPRLDVRDAIDASGVYASWNALCCGVEQTLSFPEGALDLTVEVLLASGAVLLVPTPPDLTLEQLLIVTQ